MLRWPWADLTMRNSAACTLMSRVFVAVASSAFGGCKQKRKRKDVRFRFVLGVFDTLADSRAV